ncbi:amidohydrolase family protein [Sphingobium sp. YR768]|uniref:amidohydrolase family protein n=1 Tax=Sphingobium sp. YR768 TaxID=1884365 RepID=UPI0008C6C85F|nr:amidohydrolase family protein [Sphingobium sp. YR768]SER33807.1 Imidazolonepropionase [Sphingobium sp. YR768]
MRFAASLLLGAALVAAPMAHAQEKDALSLQPTRMLAYDAQEGTWMQPDMAPDGKTILFDLLGDIYALDATGGTARPLLTGMAFERNPVFSPDGRQFAFISDRSGVTNLWLANVDGTGLKQLSHDSSVAIYSSPAWSADGRFVTVSRTVHSILAFELFLYDKDGGSGIQITKAGSPDNWDAKLNAMGAVAAPDGRTLYYATKRGHTWTENDLPNWSIARRDLKTGQEEVIIQSAGGAMRPALSHDGRLLVYASRDGMKDGLRLRNLETGEDRWIAFPIDRDGQDGGYYADLLPRFSFMPGDKALLMSVGGKLQRLDIASGARTDIPFTAPVKLGLGPLTRVHQKEEEGPVRVRVIQAPRQSPDGKSVAFTALGGLYVQSLAPGAKPRKIVADDAFQPGWSPDGKTIVYVSWTATEGGHVWTIPSTGGKPRRLTQFPAFYTQPVFTPDGRGIVALRANHYDRLRTISEIDPSRPTDIIALSAQGGPARLITHATGARLPHFAQDGRLLFYSGAGVSSVPLAGGDPQLELRVVAPGLGQYFPGPAPVDEVRLSPDGRHALVKSFAQIYLIDVPPANGSEPPTIDLNAASVARNRLTRIGADFTDWADKGATVTWSVGSTFRRLPTAQALSGNGEATAQSFALPVDLPRDVPKGSIVLRGATVMPMAGGQDAIANADILITDNRIVAVGPAGSLTVPAGASVRDVSGKYIVPGFVDTHAHWFEIRRGIQDKGHWDFAANLAFGVTSALDVQPFTTDVFAYQDMIDAGMMRGPRAWSTGPGVFVNAEIRSKQDAVDILTRYRDHYRTRNIKSYMIGDRAQRQYMVEAAKELGMMPTTEGASDMVLNLTHAIDGFSGNEHAIPVSPLRDDIVRLFAQSRTSYTPTISVAYGTTPALFDFIINKRPQDDPKFRHFVPSGIVSEKLRNRHWMPPEAQSWQLIAADALAIQRAGGLVGIGSHGEMQGLGYQWEMQAFAAGGATPMEVLRAATIGSAEVIGHSDDVGSLEPGKFADLLILDADPRPDIANAMKIGAVMKNGRIYDPATLDEVWPAASKAPTSWFDGTDRPN